MLINYQIKSSSFDVAKLLSHTHTHTHTHTFTAECRAQKINQKTHECTVISLVETSIVMASV